MLTNYFMDISKIREAIAQRENMGNEDPKPKKPGLKFYAGGKEKTPTGMSNAFKDAGINEEQVYSFAKEYNLPVSSNKEFQEATIALLEKTPEGKAKLDEINSKYGVTKAGTLADNMLGARTVDIMRSIIQNKKKPEEPPLENPPLVEPVEPEKEVNKKTEYSFTWRDDNKEGGQDTYYFKDKASYDEALKQQIFKNRGFLSSTKTGQGSRERGASSLFISNPFINMK